MGSAEMRPLGPECCLLLNLHPGAHVSTSPEGRRDAESPVVPLGSGKVGGEDVQGDLIMAR